MLQRLLDCFYPALCELCQKSLKNGRSLCTTCAEDLPKISEPFCQNCGETFDGNIEGHFQCNNCLGSTHDFHFARAALKGHTLPFHLVHSLKYRRHFYIARELARFLAETWKEDDRFRQLGANAILIPVPLHWRRQQTRHANQAFELAREMSKLTGLPFRNALKRARPTLTQTKLNRKQRLSNLHGAFQMKKRHLPHLRRANVILIDDVFTTGATAHECTRVLKHQGKASKVAILTLVRG